MKVIICIEDRGGYSFHNRRLSSDVRQQSHMLHKLEQLGGYLVYNRYSERMLQKDEIKEAQSKQEEYNYRMQNGTLFLQDASVAVMTHPELSYSNLFAFVENVSLRGYYSEIEEIMLYRWNRTYPFDLQLTEEFLAGFDVVEEEELEGTSHERITYQRLILKKKAGEKHEN